MTTTRRRGDRVRHRLVRLVHHLVPARRDRRLPVRAIQRRETHVTTPERLRARQLQIERRERRIYLLVALLCAGLVASALYFRAQDQKQRDCINSYISAQAETGALRSRLVERESDATRTIISKALTAETREALVAARESYFAELRAIDEARAANPVNTLASECD